MSAPSAERTPVEERPGRPAGPLTILHVIPTLGVGGTERQLAKLLPRLDPARFRQTVCWYTRSETLEAPLRAAGIRTVFLDKVAMRPWTFFAELRSLVRETRPDIVHTWLYSGNFWGRMAAITCGVRGIVASDRGVATAASAAVVLYERALASRTTRIVNSRAAAASLSDRYGLPASSIRIIPNAVDPAEPPSAEARRAARAALGLPGDAAVILMTARQTEEKNHPMFFRAARRVGERRNGVLFVALGRLFRPEAMRQAVADAGAARFVRVEEQREDVGLWLAAADLFCLTSDSEGLPNSVLEAMAAGLPVVCTDFAAAREILAREELGLVVPRGDDAALAEAILALLDDGARRARMAQAARHEVTQRFGWSRLVSEMESLYEEVAARTAPGGAGRGGRS